MGAQDLVLGLIEDAVVELGPCRCLGDQVPMSYPLQIAIVASGFSGFHSLGKLAERSSEWSLAMEGFQTVRVSLGTQGMARFSSHSSTFLYPER